MKVKSRRRLEKQLGRIMIDSGLINEEQLDKALEIHNKDRNTLIGKVLMDLGFIEEEGLVHALINQYYLSYLPLDKYSINPEAVCRVPQEIARRHMAIPIDKIGFSLTVAMSNPLDAKALSEIESLTGCNVQPIIATSTEILRTINKYYGAISHTPVDFHALPHSLS